MNNPEFTPWEKRALAALRAYNQAMERAKAAARQPDVGWRVDPDRAALNDRVMAFAAEHQLTYADALDRVLNDL